MASMRKIWNQNWIASRWTPSRSICLSHKPDYSGSLRAANIFFSIICLSEAGMAYHPKYELPKCVLYGVATSIEWKCSFVFVVVLVECQWMCSVDCQNIPQLTLTSVVMGWCEWKHKHKSLILKHAYWAISSKRKTTAACGKNRPSIDRNKQMNDDDDSNEKFSNHKWMCLAIWCLLGWLPHKQLFNQFPLSTRRDLSI